MSDDTIGAPRARELTLPRQQVVWAAIVLFLVLESFSIAFVDRPVARYVGTHQDYRLFFQCLAAPSLLSLPLAAIYLAIRAYGVVAGRKPGRYGRLYLTICVAVVAATAVKDELKFIFGRPWPVTFEKFGLYVFHPFVSGSLFGSFPSGHTTYIAAPMCVLWFMVPRYRPVWAGLILMVMIGLVGANYHYVGDVIGGFFLGLAVATGTLALTSRASG